MEDINVSSVNAEPAVNVEPQVNEQVETDNNVSGEVVNTQSEQKPVQDAQTNAMYAKIRRESEMKAKDTVIAEMYGKSHGIYTYADYQKALQAEEQRKQAENLGVNPEFYNEFTSMKQKLESMEREKTILSQERQLESDPHVGELFKEWKNDVKELSERYKVDLDTAFTLLTRERIPDILNKTKSKVEQETIKKLNSNALSTPGALGAEGAEHKTGYSTLTAAEKKAFREKVLRGEITEF